VKPKHVKCNTIKNIQSPRSHFARPKRELEGIGDPFNRYITIYIIIIPQFRAK
jgi:hypothetical protein